MYSVSLLSRCGHDFKNKYCGTRMQVPKSFSILIFSFKLSGYKTSCFELWFVFLFLYFCHNRDTASATLEMKGI